MFIEQATALPVWKQRALDASRIRRDSQRTRQLFTRSRQVEEKYAVALRKIARHVGDIVRGFPAGDPKVLPDLNASLTAYAEMLRPWAEHTAKRITLEIARWDERAWNKHTQEMSAAIRQQLAGADLRPAFRELEREQVVLIQSIPITAAQRVHKLTMEGLATGRRASEIVDEIMRSGHVARSHAELIAFTETSRCATAFTRARAEAVGSDVYIWRTVGDARVRELHRKLNGKVFRWDSPPVSGEKGERSHPGGIYRCRCWPEVIIPQ